tara:strand:- start:17 stop:184 length:168 start_codon:yes stop_codon:yes gene_type:complete
MLNIIFDINITKATEKKLIAIILIKLFIVLSFGLNALETAYSLILFFLKNYIASL